MPSKCPITTTESSERVVMPKPISEPVPPALFAKASVPSGLYFATKMSFPPADVSVVTPGSPAPKVAAPAYPPVTTTESSERVVIP